MLLLLTSLYPLCSYIFMLFVKNLLFQRCLPPGRHFQQRPNAAAFTFLTIKPSTVGVISYESHKSLGIKPSFVIVSVSKFITKLIIFPPPLFV